MQRNRNAWKPVVLQLLNGRYEQASAAVAYGSPVRGEDKQYSDIDLIVVGDLDAAPAKESLLFGGWPLEIHLHTAGSLWEVASRRARQDRRAALPHMFVNGQMLFDRDGVGGTLKQRFTRLLDDGPSPLADRELVMFRYRITDGIADLSDPRPLGEVMFAAARLAQTVADFVLARNRSWLSTGKAVHRNLSSVDAELADRLAAAWAGVGDDAQPLIALADEVLESVGGRLFEGETAGV